MGLYVNNNPTLAPIGAVAGQNENNTTPAVITNQIRVDRLKAAQPQFRGTTPAGNDFKNLFGNLKVDLTCPRTKSEFSREQLCGAHVLAENIDFLA